jgi:hypothetical protein
MDVHAGRLDAVFIQRFDDDPAFGKLFSDSAVA